MLSVIRSWLCQWFDHKWGRAVYMPGAIAGKKTCKRCGLDTIVFPRPRGPRKVGQREVGA